MPDTRSLVPEYDPAAQRFLGGWHVRTENVPEGKALVSFDHGRRTWPGGKSRVTIELDVTLSASSAMCLNRIVQALADMVAVGAVDGFPASSLVRFEAPPHAPDPDEGTRTAYITAYMAEGGKSGVHMEPADSA